VPISVNKQVKPAGKAGVETPASKLKSSQRGLKNSLVLFERTLAIRQGIDSKSGLTGRRKDWVD
jgi:hypothetical protein